MKINSNLSKTLLSSIITISLGFSSNATADDSDQIKSSLMSRMTSSASSFVSTGIGSLLSPKFDTVEVSTNLKEGDSTVDIGVLKAFGDNPNSFLFNQINLNRYDKRTTLNLGFGYRRLNADETWLTGVNAFYVIWRELKYFRVLSYFLKLRFFRIIAEIFYKVWLNLR